MNNFTRGDIKTATKQLESAYAQLLYKAAKMRMQLMTLAPIGMAMKFKSFNKWFDSINIRFYKINK